MYKYRSPAAGSPKRKEDQLGVGQPVPGVGTATTPNKSRRSSSLLEQELQAELHHARRHRSRGDDAERSRRVNVVSRRIELCMIEDVKRIYVKLQGAALPQFRGLDQRHVEVELTWPRNGTDCVIAKPATSIHERRARVSRGTRIGGTECPRGTARHGILAAGVVRVRRSERSRVGRASDTIGG